jgi:AcrR family transcriptional regulator
MTKLSTRQEGLRRGDVLEVAITLTHELGLDDLTNRAIADRLGVWPTTVKHHLGDIDDVKDAVADELAGRIPIPKRGRWGWQRWLRTFATGARHHIRDYAGVARRIQQRGATSPQQIKVIDTVSQVMLDAGFSARDAALAYGVLINWIVDFAEVEAYRRHESDEATAIRDRMASLGRNQAALLQGFGTVAAQWAATDADDWFEFGLDIIIAGFERRCLKR